MSDKPILVTGATGSISSLVIPQLLASGSKVRALVHGADKAKALSDKGVEVIVGDLDNPASLEKAFKGISTVFLLTPFGEKADALARNAITAAKKAGRPYVVRLSAVKAGLDAPTANGRSHGQTEKDLNESGLPVAILKPHYFMQNIFGSAQTIATEGVFYHGMGEGKLGMIDVRDIADSAVKALLDPSLAGKTFTLTGPESITFHTVAQAFTAALGRPVKDIAIPPEAVADNIRKMGWGEWAATVMRDYSAAYGSGWADFVTEDVKKLAGHPARSIAQFAREVLSPALSKR
ncbi:MAG: SDR family oxidoreductase [Spirochaetia bacterium]|jgi:uncharacterized protein YbjT (DUF2867 family)